MYLLTLDCVAAKCSAACARGTHSSLVARRVRFSCQTTYFPIAHAHPSARIKTRAGAHTRTRVRVCASVCVYPQRKHSHTLARYACGVDFLPAFAALACNNINDVNLCECACVCARWMRARVCAAWEVRIQKQTGLDFYVEPVCQNSALTHGCTTPHTGTAWRKRGCATIDRRSQTMPTILCWAGQQTRGRSTQHARVDTYNCCGIYTHQNPSITARALRRRHSIRQYAGALTRTVRTVRSFERRA